MKNNELIKRTSRITALLLSSLMIAGLIVPGTVTAETEYEFEYLHEIAEYKEPDSYPDKEKIELSPTYSKQIDYLGDNDTAADNNPDTLVDDEGFEGRNDMYRLYLDLKGDSEAIDLLLVLDESTSMLNGTLEDGTIREEALEEFLNGDTDDRGFIRKFLDNPGNNIAIVGFGTKARVIQNWTDDYSKDIDLNTLLYDENGRKNNNLTNYSAGLFVADELLKSGAIRDTGNKKIMLFLSDGMPVIAYADGRMRNDNSKNNAFVAKKDTIYDSYSDLVYILSRMNQTGRTVEDAFDRGYQSDVCYGLEGTQPTLFGGIRCNEETNGASIVQTIFGDIKLLEEPPGFSFTSGITDQNAISQFWLQGAMKIRDAKKSMSAADWNEVEKYYAKYFDASGIEGARQVDIFNLTKLSFIEFMGNNEGVTVNTIGYSSEVSGVSTDMNGNSRSSSEVLEFMAKYGAGQYWYSGNQGDLAVAINNQCFMTKTEITDELSENVKVADRADLKVVCKDAENTQTILYANGNLTEEGRSILQSVSLDASAGKLSVKFRPEYAIREDLTYSASFNVQASEEAYDKYESSGYSDEGEAHTDFGTNATSSGMKGFFSNDEAVLSWETAGFRYDEDYPKPVIQIADSVLYELPSAGSAGIYWIIVIGSMLITLSVRRLVHRVHSIMDDRNVF